MLVCLWLNVQIRAVCFLRKEEKRNFLKSDLITQQRGFFSFVIKK